MNEHTVGHNRQGSWFTRTSAVVMVTLAVTCSGVTLDAASASAAVSAQHAVAKAGRPTVRLTVPQHSFAGGVVTVLTKGTKVPGHVRTVVLDFGDRSPKLHASALPASKTHRYAKAGHFRVTLTVTDRAGHTAKVSHSITVKKPPAGAGLGAARPTKNIDPAPGLATSALPAVVSLKAGAMPVQYQGDVGSCVTYAIDYAMLGWYANHQGIAGAPFAPMYAYSQINLGGALTGSHPEDALRLAQSQGTDTVADYGSGSYYDWQTKPTAAQTANAANYKIAGWNTVFAGATRYAGAAGANAIKAQLAAGHPVAIGMAVPASGSLQKFRGTGVYNDTSKKFDGGHEVLALGYNASGLLIQNSWGTQWGNGGFGYLSWAVVENDVDEADVITGLVPRQAASDTTAPTVSVPTLAMATDTTMTGTMVPVTVSWSGADDSGAVAGYDLWASTNGGSWAKQTLAADGTTSVTYNLVAGYRYRFAVRARDAAGNLSQWSADPAFTVQDSAETDRSIQWSQGWTYQPWSDADGGQQATSVTPQAWAYFTFTGTNLAWITTKASNRGQANVFIDNKFVGTVDLYSATPVARTIAATLNAPSSGTHTVEIDVVGTSGRPNVDVDSFIVLG